ncbi:hypothetical protein EYZ11_012923 [Aspergillus tanneri]|uniref:Uncharacterized protein n=1 Tax=Aspergillus tanneri TaxID=1220188 RepID=A0A4V3UMK3_9EURO|nr:hypothetical protein EYZ11_012923 [Aspergillus tanneri]
MQGCADTVSAEEAAPGGWPSRSAQMALRKGYR